MLLRPELSRQTHSLGGGRHGLAAVGARSPPSTEEQSEPSVSGRRSTADAKANQSTDAVFPPRQGPILHELVPPGSHFGAKHRKTNYSPGCYTSTTGPKK